MREKEGRGEKEKSPARFEKGWGGLFPHDQTFAAFKSSADCRPRVTFPLSINSSKNVSTQPNEACHASSSPSPLALQLPRSMGTSEVAGPSSYACFHRKV